MNLQIYNKLMSDLSCEDNYDDCDESEIATEEQIKIFAELFPEEISPNHHASDVYGNLRCRFQTKTKNVIFSSSKNPEHSYVYFESAGKYDIEKPLTKKLVIKYLKWLQEDVD